MHLNSLIAKSELFREHVIESGFRRDLGDYLQSIQQGHNQNLVFMKDLSKRIQQKFFEFENFGLNHELKTLLRDRSFIEKPTFEQLVALDQDNTIDAGSYHQQLNSIIAQLTKSIDQNEREINSLTEMLLNYVDNDLTEEGSNITLIAIVFKDLKTTKNLKDLSRALGKWNRTLSLFHTLLSSESPSEIEIAGVQQGSIEIICNLDIDVSIDVAEVVNHLTKVFLGYLAYKSKFATEIIEMFKADKKMIEHENKREKLMIDVIKDSVTERLTELHKAKVEKDKNIITTDAEKKIDEIVKVLIDHFINGNELKFLTTVPDLNDSEEDLTGKLKKQVASIREHMKTLSEGDLKLLLDTFSIKPSDDDESINNKNN